MGRPKLAVFPVVFAGFLTVLSVGYYNRYRLFSDVFDAKMKERDESIEKAERFQHQFETKYKKEIRDKVKEMKQGRE